MEKKDVSDLANITELGTTDTNFLEQTYVIESIDFALYEAWIKLDSLLLLKDSSNYLSDEIQKEIKWLKVIFCKNWSVKNNKKLTIFLLLCTEFKINLEKWKLHAKIWILKNFPD